MDRSRPSPFNLIYFHILKQTVPINDVNFNDFLAISGISTVIFSMHFLN